MRLVGPLSLAIALALAPAARAGTVSTYSDPETEGGNSMEFRAAPGERNTLVIRLSRDRREYLLEDSTAPVTTNAAESGCRQVDDHSVACSVGAGSNVLVDLADGDDSLVMAAYSPSTFEAVELVGGPGDDRITGGAREETIHGDAGDDILRGNARADRLVGGDGADRLYGGYGRDTLDGGGGSDLLVAWDGGIRDSLLGGGGRDRAQVDQRDVVRACERVQRTRR